MSTGGVASGRNDLMCTVECAEGRHTGPISWNDEVDIKLGGDNKYLLGMAPVGNFLLNDKGKCKVVAKAEAGKKNAWRIRAAVVDVPWYRRKGNNA